MATSRHSDPNRYRPLLLEQAQPNQQPVRVSVPFSNERIVPVADYLRLLRQNLGTLAVFTGLAGCLAFAGSYLLPSFFEATAIVEVNREAPKSLLGQEPGKPIAFDDTDQFLSTQIRLIQSSSVLRPVAQKYHLLELEQQAHAPAAQKAPVVLSKLSVKRQPESSLILVSYRARNPQIAADVANAIAASFIDFAYTIRLRSSTQLTTFMAQHLTELRQKMEHSAQALSDFERDLDIITPDEHGTIVSSRLVQLNSEFTAAQGDRIRKQALFDATEKQPLEAAQISGQADALLRLEEQINDANERFATIKTEYGSQHPEYLKAASRLTELKTQLDHANANVLSRVALEYHEAQKREALLANEVATVKAESDRINGRSVEYRRLRQEADADRQLYQELESKVQTNLINAGFQDSSFRIVDAALPPFKPVFPRPKLNAVLAAFLAALLYMVWCLARNRMDTTVRDADDIRFFLHTDVVASLPQVKGSPLKGLLTSNTSPHTSRSLWRSTALTKSQDPSSGYCLASPFEEGIRFLRNCLNRQSANRAIKSVLITSPNSGDGKTTTALGLALALSRGGKRTLLINCDLRRPVNLIDEENASHSGLAEVLRGTCNWQDAVSTSSDRPLLDILQTGQPDIHSSDLLTGVGTVLRSVSELYDAVVLDGPPALGFAETSQIAAVTDVVAVVGRVGRTDRRDLKAVLEALNRSDASLLGVVLNRTKHAAYGDSSAPYSQRALISSSRD